MKDQFYLIRRNDGHTFLQRYVPKDYQDTTFEVLAQVSNVWEALALLRVHETPSATS